MLTRVTTCFLAAATLVLVMASSAHARLQPIRNYDLPVATGSGKEIQAEALRRVIIEAGQKGKRKWTFSNAGQDKLIAVLAVKSSRIQVEVEYSPERVWIRYMSSENLREQGGNIHPSYNKWVGEFVHAMHARLTRF